MATPSTYLSRRVYVAAPQLLEWICVIGEQPFRVRPPFYAEAGVYRANLDVETRTATITEEGAA